MASAKKKVTYKVNYPHGLNLREEPSKNAKVLKILAFDEMVEPGNKAAPDGWIAVKGGGYVLKEFLTQN